MTTEKLNHNQACDKPLLTKGEDGHLIGKNPLSIGTSLLKKAGHRNKPMAKIMREKCFDCCGGQTSEVRKCTATDCVLWPYRMGTNPYLSAKRKANNPDTSKLKRHGLPKPNETTDQNPTPDQVSLLDFMQDASNTHQGT